MLTILAKKDTDSTALQIVAVINQKSAGEQWQPLDLTGYVSKKPLLEPPFAPASRNRFSVSLSRSIPRHLSFTIVTSTSSNSNKCNKSSGFGITSRASFIRNIWNQRQRTQNIFFRLSQNVMVSWCTYIMLPLFIPRTVQLFVSYYNSKSSSFIPMPMTSKCFNKPLHTFAGFLRTIVFIREQSRRMTFCKQSISMNLEICTMTAANLPQLNSFMLGT